MARADRPRPDESKVHAANALDVMNGRAYPVGPAGIPSCSGWLVAHADGVDECCAEDGTDRPCQAPDGWHSYVYGCAAAHRDTPLYLRHRCKRCV
jgi:hypothetical protein